MTVTPNLPHEDRLKNAARMLKGQFVILLFFVALFWGLELIDWMLGGALDNYGIVPRTRDGLRGIFFAPILHFGFEHVLANTVPFVILGWFVLLRGTQRFIIVTIIASLVGGMGIWLFGATFSNHLGASILVFGYMGYLLFISIFERSLQAMTLTLLTLFLYGSLLWGLLPLLEGVSWEGHLFGFIGGGLAAQFVGKNRGQVSLESLDL